MMYLLNPFHGYMSRSQWWLWIFLILLTTVLSLFVLSSGGAVLESAKQAGKTEEIKVALAAIGGGFLLWFFLSWYMTICMCANRLRDSGRSMFWILAFHLPFIGTFIMIYFCGVEGSERGNFTYYD